MEKYENPIQHACDIEEGQVFITEGWKRPGRFVKVHGRVFHHLL